MVRNCNITAEHPLNPATVQVLLIEDDLAAARFLQEVLKGAPHSRFTLSHAKCLGEAILRLQAQSFDVALLDLTLPDSSGLDSLDLLLSKAPGLPVVVLTNTNDNELAVSAVRRGAQDYLLKRSLQQEVLVRALFYAIERQRAEDALREVNEVLEDRVRARTAELEAANQHLRQEIQQRQHIQERLTLAQEAASMVTFEWALADLPCLQSANAQCHSPHCPLPWRLHPDDCDVVAQELCQSVQAGRGLDAEFRILEGDTIRWLAIKSTLLYDEQGQPDRLLGIHMDITDKKQMEAQFLRSQRLESLGTLASGIAHDLNNILTPIILVVQLLPLKLGNLDPWVDNKLKILESSAQRGADMVKQILTFARGLEGKRTDLRVNHLLLDIRKLMQQTLPKSIDIYVDVPDDLWAVSGDATQLHQVLMNLCVNARDAMPQGGVLQITAHNLALDATSPHPQAHPGPYVVVMVTDTGTGIEPKALNRIFDPFFTTKEPGKGTGLGLSAVLGIVENHGGFIDVHSTVNQGSQFCVYLPAILQVDPAQPDHADPLDGHQATILVVDDEPSICAVIKSMLESHNYQVILACDAPSALALFAEHHLCIAAIITDIMMPTMDGLTALPLLRRINADIPIIAMSGLSLADLAQAEARGFQGFLPKPFTHQDLLQQLQALPLRASGP
ncbi:MAG: response regulator [Leptolyngbya sp.]|nr:response regulator [Leptolyngbya sp.]